jgi:AbiV family abortive infection protein
MRGRQLYRHLAEEAAKNARRFKQDAGVLRRRGSAGHACSIAILAVEEASKAIVYKLAAEGIFRIVKKNPNNISTFSESSLLEHRFKHAMIARVLIGALEYGPFQSAMESTRKKNFTRGEVESLFRRVHAHQVLQAAELQSGGRASRELSQIMTTLGQLNGLKNDGLYVGHKNGKIGTPNGRARSELARVWQLAEITVTAASVAVRTEMDPRTREEWRKHTRIITAGLIRTAERRKGLLKSPSFETTRDPEAWNPH